MLRKKTSCATRGQGVCIVSTIGGAMLPFRGDRGAIGGQY
jgi:hypothetical protein